jgi:diphosphomevalonate decarboxylase
MHGLFETAVEAFTYRQEASLRVLDFLQDYWQRNGDGPLVTMDAGPNVHLLFRPEQAEMAQALKRQLP